MALALCLSYLLLALALLVPPGTDAQSAGSGALENLQVMVRGTCDSRAVVKATWDRSSSEYLVCCRLHSNDQLLHTDEDCDSQLASE